MVIEFINKDGHVQYTEPSQRFLDQDNSLMELLIFKQEQIVTSFQNELIPDHLNAFKKIQPRSLLYRLIFKVIY